MPELHMWHVPEHAKLIYGHGNQNTGLLWGTATDKGHKRMWGFGGNDLQHYKGACRMGKASVKIY